MLIRHPIKRYGGEGQGIFDSGVDGNSGQLAGFASFNVDHPKLSGIGCCVGEGDMFAISRPARGRDFCIGWQCDFGFSRSTYWLDRQASDVAGKVAAIGCGINSKASQAQHRFGDIGNAGITNNRFN